MKEINIFFDYSVVLRVSPPPKVLIIFGRGKKFLTSAISPKQNGIESNV